MSQQQSDGDEPEGPRAILGRGVDREKMAANYLPESDDWPAKTVLELNDPAALAALSIFGDLYPEVSDLQDPIDEFLDDYLRARTSVGGMSRDEYKSIIMSMYGGIDDDDQGKMVRDLLAADLGEE